MYGLQTTPASQLPPASAVTATRRQPAEYAAARRFMQLPTMTAKAGNNRLQTMQVIHNRVTQMRRDHPEDYSKLRQDIGALLAMVFPLLPEIAHDLLKLAPDLRGPPDLLATFLPLLFKAVTPRVPVDPKFLKYRVYRAYLKTLEANGRSAEVKRVRQFSSGMFDILDRLTQATSDVARDGPWYTLLAVTLSGLIGNGYVWLEKNYVVDESEEFHDRPLLRNCDDECRPGYESIFTMDKMKEPGCCLDNQCYDMKELEEYIRFRGNEGYAATLPHSSRPINRKWLRQQCPPGDWSSWFASTVGRRRHAE